MQNNRRVFPKIIQFGLVSVLLVTIVVNVMFMLDTHRRYQSRFPSMPEPQYYDENEIQTKVEKNHVEVIETHKPQRQTSKVEVVSSKQSVLVKVNDKTVVHDKDFDSKRGIHVIVLHQSTMQMMSHRVFDTYQEHEDEAMTLFLNLISNGRVLILCIKDEGSFHLKPKAREHLTSLGSEYAKTLGWREMWVFITTKGGAKIAENYAQRLQDWSDDVKIVTLVSHVSRQGECFWNKHSDGSSLRRRVFCDKYEGYGSVCSCTDPSPFVFNTSVVKFDNLVDVPVAVIASDRPQYLFQALSALLSVPGARPSMVTVFIDGFHTEAMDVTRLFEVRGIHHTPLGVKNARISQHYKSSLTATFSLYPKARYMIILEEDLQVSPDFLNYFDQLLPLIEKDPSIYCVSAWNDLGYEHSSKDPGVLYRVETMPGLGWMLKRSLYKDELEPNWPSAEKQWDWDMWMRNNAVRHNRECVIPDVSRTYHFGTTGLNVNPYFQDIYFKKHAFMTLPRVKLKNVEQLQKDKYELVLEDLMKKAVTLNHSKSPCDDSFIPSTTDQIYVMYITMTNSVDYTSWLQVAKCFHVWDLDARGFHKGLWRLYIRNNHILVIGVPFSPYSSHKSVSLTPIHLTTPPPKP